ncbi:hypothetical protein FNV43_RR27035 [Rhamnella rubrinervis]|uniref:Uncharacterized protein n=1 Tax=Rhamnella rubrinervis TaxID=2594499 RepID=A0A8K0GS51_9ROSA|nr:hypothetical protein FNV43_RR27035 [Rhamnella rubrinervis]
MGPVLVNGPLPPFSYERIREDYFNRANVITNAMVKDVYTNTTQWIEDDDIVKLSLLYILECSLLRKESHFEVNMDHVRMVWSYETILKLGKFTSHKLDDVVFPPICRCDGVHEEQDHDAHDSGGDAETPLKRARTTIIHEGCDAHHSSTQELPHQNVHHFEAVSYRQLKLIHSDIASLKKQFDEHQLYVKSELMSIKETLKCILTFTLMDKKTLDKGENSEKYTIPPSMQDEDVIYHGLIVKDIDTENNEDAVKTIEDNIVHKDHDDTQKNAKDSDVLMEEGLSNDDQGDGDVHMDEEPSNNNQNEEAT